MLRKVMLLIVSASLIVWAVGCSGGGASNSVFPPADFLLTVKSGSELLQPTITGTTVTLPLAAISAVSKSAMSGKVVRVQIDYLYQGASINTAAGLLSPHTIELNQNIGSNSTSSPKEITISVLEVLVYLYMTNNTADLADDRSPVSARLTFVMTDSLDRWVDNQVLYINLKTTPRA